MEDLCPLGDICPKQEVRARTQSQHTQTLPGCCWEYSSKATEQPFSAFPYHRSRRSQAALDLPTLLLHLHHLTLAPSTSLHKRGKSIKTFHFSKAALHALQCLLKGPSQICFSSPKPSFTFKSKLFPYPPCVALQTVLCHCAKPRTSGSTWRTPTEQHENHSIMESSTLVKNH